MLQDRHATDNPFEHIVTLTNDMDPVLAQIDPLLDIDAQDVADGAGPTSAAAWVDPPL